MNISISRPDAQNVITQLLNSPIAPGAYSHFINVGTDPILNSLETNYFRGALADGISCFKYLEGDYGSGKTQFIWSLMQKAHENDIVPSLVSISKECPFNSQLAIFRAVLGNFLPSNDGLGLNSENRGIEILIHNWIVRKLRSMGMQPGQQVPDMVRRQVERAFTDLWLGAPDQQMAGALAGLGKRLLDQECDAVPAVLDRELIEWVRGDTVRSRGLRDTYGLYEPARDENAFKRLKTVIGFLRSRMGYRGFFVAFDEGTRTASFRRGSVQQRQAIENMLTMINDNADGQFGGVMFMYAATPDFRSDIISRSYTALNDRIGSVAFSPGSPMVPLIDLEKQNSDVVTRQIGERLMDVFEVARDLRWDREIQNTNMEYLIAAQKQVLVLLDKVPPRVFVYQYCRFLSQQEQNQQLISEADATAFVQGHELPEREDGA